MEQPIDSSQEISAKGDLFLVDQSLSQMLTIGSGATGRFTEDKSFQP